MNRILLLWGLLVIVFVDANAQIKTLSGSALFGSLRARQIGPAVMSGRVTSIDAVADSPEIIYVGSASGGVWKSLSGGALFRPVFDDHTMSIGKVKIDPSNSDIVWVGTGEPWVRNSTSVGTGIYKSINGGTSWEHLGLEDSERISDIIVHPSNSDIVYVAALGHLWDANEERGVFKTIDGGKTWTKILYIDENTGAADIDIDPQDPDILYAAMWSFRRQPHTFDSGFTGKSGLFKSTNGGDSWDKIQQGLPEEKLGRMAIGVAPSNGDVIYASVECKTKEKRGLYLSTNKGGTWEKVSDEFNTTVRPFYFANILVDPKNDSILIKAGLQAVISEDRGERFLGFPQSVHSDMHDFWIDPNNTKHIFVGTDGGVYESFDRGRSFKMFGNLPLSQFYHVDIDTEEPYNVYGGLQDNGSWFGPSQSPGGISNSDWQFTYGGDGFYSFPHPTDNDIVYVEYQGGNLARYNKKTGRAKDIRPYAAEDEDKYRFNWNSPVTVSPTKPDRIYFGAQYLFKSDDRGESWSRISPDLTTNDPEKQKQKESGGLTIDNSTAENHCTIYTIAESPLDEQVIWVGTDDGNLQLSMDGGANWTNVRSNIKDLPANTWVTFIDPGHQDKQMAYVTFDGHRTGDKKTYIYKTSDFGKTWSNLATEDTEGYALCVREDLENSNLLFLGTEFGLYVSLDAGANWTRFKNNMPKVGVRDMVIHPREDDLVLGTHGRGIIIIDDISPLRQVSQEILAEKVHFFETNPTILKDPGGGGDWFSGSGNYVGGNPSTFAQIIYFMNKRHTFGKMYVEVYKDGALVKTLPAGKSAGINIVEMPTSLKKPKAPPTNNRMALIGSLFGPNLAEGKYEVKLVKGKVSYDAAFELVYDKDSQYSSEDRAIQRDVTMKLYNMSEDLAYMYYVLEVVEQNAETLGEEHAKMKKSLDEIGAKAKATMKRMVALEGDFYVDEGEQIYERVSDLYRRVSGYPGKPSKSQTDRTAILEKEVKQLRSDFDQMVAQDLTKVNEALVAAGAASISYMEKQAFLEDKGGGSSTGSGLLYFNEQDLYKHLLSTPLGAQIFSINRF